MTTQQEIEIVKAALLITRATSRYSKLPWICDVFAAVQHLMSHDRLLVLLLRLQNLGEVVLRRADMVDGVANLVEASEVRFCGETWHYAGLAKEAE